MTEQVGGADDVCDDAPLRLLARAACAIGASAAAAQEPFYKGKRLTLLINFAAGGPTDIEGRLLAKHIAKHIDGQPQIIVQNKDGAGGLVGTNYRRRGRPARRQHVRLLHRRGLEIRDGAGEARASISAPSSSSAISPATPSTTCAATRRPA